MSRRRNHMTVGVVFIVACLAIGIVLFIALKRSNEQPPPVTDNKADTTSPTLIPADPNTSGSIGADRSSQQAGVLPPPPPDTTPITQDPIAAACTNPPVPISGNPALRTAWCNCIHDQAAGTDAGSVKTTRDTCEILADIDPKGWVRRFGPPQPAASDADTAAAPAEQSPQ